MVAQPLSSSWIRSMYCMCESSFEVGVENTTNGLARFRHPGQKNSRTGFVEPLIQIPALRTLHARGAAVLAGTALEHVHRVGNPAFELVEAALGDPHAAGMPVVDEDRRLPGVGVDVRRTAAV